MFYLVSNTLRQMGREKSDPQRCARLMSGTGLSLCCISTATLLDVDYFELLLFLLMYGNVIIIFLVSVISIDMFETTWLLHRPVTVR